jgi:transposase
MNALHYIGFDIHKKAIRFCVKTAAGEIVEEGSVPAQRGELRRWASARPQPWRGALDATLLSGWIYDTLKPYGEQLEMAHPAKDRTPFVNLTASLASRPHSSKRQETSLSS